MSIRPTANENKCSQKKKWKRSSIVRKYNRPNAQDNPMAAYQSLQRHSLIIMYLQNFFFSLLLLQGLLKVTASSSTRVRPPPFRLVMSSKATKFGTDTFWTVTGSNTTGPLKEGPIPRHLPSRPYIPNVCMSTNFRRITGIWPSSGDFFPRLSTHPIVR